MCPGERMTEFFGPVAMDESQECMRVLSHCAVSLMEEMLVGVEGDVFCRGLGSPLRCCVRSWMAPRGGAGYGVVWEKA